MTPAENRLTEWLRDAQAMEKQAEVMLDALAEGIEHYPDVNAQIERHFQQAREQAAALQALVERFREGAPTRTGKPAREGSHRLGYADDPEREDRQMGS